MQKKQVEQTLSYNVVDDWDVVVAGGGPAGCAAAAAAARDGARTLLIEATGALGGMGTSGLIPFWTPFSDGEKMIARGFAQDVFERNKEGQPQLYRAGLDWIAIDAERLKVIYDDLVASAGAEVRFFTTVIHTATAEEGVVDHITTASKSGIEGHRAAVFIDCTGDADVAVGAGAAYEKGDASQDLQPATLCFQLSNADTFAYLYEKKPKAGDDLLKEIARDQKYPLIRDTHLYCIGLIGPGVIGFNAGHLWGVDGTKAASLSAGIVRGRKLAREIQEALAEYYPQTFGNAHLSATANLVGIRETRRVMGDYVFTIDDYLNRRTFPDEICRNAYCVDIHQTESEIKDVMNGSLQNDRRYELYKPGESYGIPYRCLTPKGLKNILVAGRSISTDRIANGSTRIMPVCLVLGEAAGIAAAMVATTDSPDVHTVDTDRLREKMQKYGAYLPKHEDASA